MSDANVTACGTGAVAVGGDVNAPITVTVTMTQRRLSDVMPTDEQWALLFDRLGGTTYSPRPWLEDLVTGFLAGRGGYFLIEAEAGMGKSVFAAVQARRHECPAYFPDRQQVGTRLSEAARRSLIAQLLSRWDVPADDLLPTWADEAGGLGRAIRHAAAQRDRVSPETPVVLVVDGLDEFVPTAEERTAGNPVPYGLPLDLPRGVFVLATARGGAALGPLRRAATVCDWRDHADDNREDMRRYLLHLVDQGGLTEAGPLPGDFVPTLVDRCGGLWLYLRIVLTQIFLGQRDPATIDALPAALDDFFHEEFEALSERPDWDDVMRPLLGALTAALEPLGHDRLAAFAGAVPRAVRRLLLTPLNPFLWIGGVGRQFALYHDSLRAFLSTADTGDTPFRSELAEAAADAHHAIADHYLTTWGGLDTGLVRLAAEAVEPDAYGLRTVVTHLAAAGRPADVHRLLAAEHDGANVWHTVRDRLNDLTGYLKDVGIAAALASGSTAGTLRYRLIAASVTSQAAVVPAALVAAMVDAGMWTTGHALEAAKRGMHDKEKNDLLRTLGARLTPDQGADALDLVAGFTDDDPRCAALVALIQHLPAPLLDRVLEMAAGVAPEIERRIVLAALAAHCAEDMKPALLDEIRRLDSPAFRAEALSKVLPHLTGALRETALELARATVAAVTFVPYRVINTRQLAEQTEPGESAALIRHALGLTRAMDPTERYDSLATLALFVPEPVRGEVLDEVREGPPRPAVTALVNLADQCEGRIAAELRDEAYAIARRLNGRDRLDALVELLPGVPDGQRASRAVEAVTAAGQGDPPTALVQQARLADRHLGGAARDEVFDRIWSRCAALTEEWEQHAVLRDWAHRFPAGPALALVRRWQNRGFRINGLIALSRDAPADRRRSLLREAYKAANRLHDAEPRAHVTAALMPYLRDESRAAAAGSLLAAAERFSRFGPVAVRYLPTDRPERRELIGQVLARTDLALDYIELAPLVPPDLFGALLDRVSAMPEPWERLAALMGIAAHVPPALLDRYIEIAMDLGHHGLWVVGSISVFQIEPKMGGRITVSPHGIHAGPLAAALAHPAVGADRARELRAETGQALRHLNQRLAWPVRRDDRLLRTEFGSDAVLQMATHPGDESASATAVAAAQVMSFRWTLAEALTALAPALEPDRRGQAVRDALRLFESIPVAWGARNLVGRSFGNLLRQLPEDERNAAVDRRLNAVAREGDVTWRQVHGLAGLAPFLPDRLLPVAAEIAGSIEDFSQDIEADARAEALAALAEIWCGDAAPLRTRIAALPDANRRGTVLAAWLRGGATLSIDRWPAPITRATLFDLVAAAAGSLRDSADEVFQAVDDVTRWWP